MKSITSSCQPAEELAVSGTVRGGRGLMTSSCLDTLIASLEVSS